jgi:transcriptional regulator GlxA family with amidase domain
MFRPPEHHYAVSIALDAFAQTEARVLVRDIAGSIGLSQRQFIQVFTNEIGMTPKLFCRVQRFQRVLALVRQNAAPDWARLAMDCGYFDQSHMIRDFLAFSGFSPSDYLRRQNSLLQQGLHIKDNHLPVAA